MSPSSCHTTNSRSWLEKVLLVPLVLPHLHQNQEGTGGDQQSPVCALCRPISSVPCGHRAEVFQMKRRALMEGADFHLRQVGEGSLWDPGL